MSELVDLVRHGRIFLSLPLIHPPIEMPSLLTLPGHYLLPFVNAVMTAVAEVIVLAGSGTSFCAGADLKSSPQPE